MTKLKDQDFELKLPRYLLTHKALMEFHDEIHQLVRLVVGGLLFEEQTSVFFASYVEPSIEKLMDDVRKVYGNKAFAKQKVQPKDISDELQSLEPLLRSDIAAALANDPATEDPLEVILCYPGFKAVRYYRIAHVLYQKKIPLLPRMITELAHEQTGIDIHPGARIGSHFFIDHGTGTVIGETAIIGQGVTIYQGVTLGAKRFERSNDGVVIKGKDRHPIIGDGVTIYSGATILGRITIGSKSVIGGNVWLTDSVPADSRITQQHYLSNYFIDGDGI